MRAAGVYFLCAPFFKRLRGLREGSGRINHVIQDYGGLTLNLSYNVHYLRHIPGGTPLVHYGKPRRKTLCKRPCPFHAPRIRRYYNHLVFEIILYMLQKDRGCVNVVNRDIKKPLYLPGMEVHASPPCRARHFYKVGNKLCRYGGSGSDLSILPRITVIWHDSGNRVCRRPF